MTHRFVAAGMAIAVLVTFLGCKSMSKAPKFALRVNCASTEPYTDTQGNVWLPDQEMAEGKTWGSGDGMTVIRDGLEVKGVPAPAIYETERYSMDNYTFKVPNGTYTVRLHFAETFDGITGVGERIFSVLINGKMVLKDFDPFKAAGGWGKPAIQECASVKVTDGCIKIVFEPKEQNPEINGIEILGQ